MLGFLLSAFFAFAPMLVFAGMVYWLDRYEKEPLFLLGGVFTWGAVVAAGGAFLVNTVLGIGIFTLTQNENLTTLTTGSLIAPVIEESLKGLAVGLVFVFFHREFDSILDGIIYAAIVALGFAATENLYYIYTYGYQENGFPGLFSLVFVRVILVGWQHPFFTAFTGIGLAIARLNRHRVVKIIAPLIGWSLAVFAHSLHNFLAELLSSPASTLFGSFIDWTGWLAMFLFALWALRREKRYLARQLQEEVSLGVLTEGQYRIACSAAAQSLERSKAVLRGNFLTTRRFYQVCGELAHKKEQRQKMGEEGDNTQQINRLRSELSHLSASIAAG